LPHLTLEYSANLENAVDIKALCQLLRDTLLDTQLFEMGAIRVRALRAEIFVVADDLPQNSFLDASLRIGAGRKPEEKTHLGELLMTAMNEFLQTKLETPHFALSLEIKEIDAQLSWKKNTIHPRLRNR